MALDFPDYPWDSLAPYVERARSHEGGMIDLSVGSPVDETPAVIRAAIAASADAHAYPQTVGTPALREAIVAWFARRRGVDHLSVANVLPTIGSKEFIAGLPLWLGLGPGDVVVQPTQAYPTYAIGAQLAGAEVLASDDPAEWPANTRLIWVNTPSNPDGRILGVDELARAVRRARELGAVIASDECYAELGWEAPYDGVTPSILDPRVIDGSRDHVLCVYSLSKQSNLAGYRAAFVAGCSDILADLLTIRKHLGLMLPSPVQAAMVAALENDAHVEHQRGIYRARRAALRPALEAAGYRIDDSRGGLYLWATKGTPSLEALAELAELGILVGPGTFYGDPDSRHVRLALTATDDAIARAVERLATLSN